MDTTDRAMLVLMFIAGMVAIAAVLDKVESRCGSTTSPVTKIRVVV